MIVDTETIYTTHRGKPHPGFYIDKTLKENMDIIKKGVKNK